MPRRPCEAELTEKINISDPKAANSRREALSSILSIEPLSSVDWLSLSGVQLVTDQPMEQVFGSLELSVMTGPNEGYVMSQRGDFRHFTMGKVVARSQSGVWPVISLQAK